MRCHILAIGPKKIKNRFVTIEQIRNFDMEIGLLTEVKENIIVVTSNYID